MLLKNCFEQHHSLRYAFQKLEFASVLGKELLLNTEMITDAEILSEELDKVEQIVSMLKDRSFESDFRQIARKIHQLNNIRPTLNSLENGTVMDDVQFFEIKKTAIIIREISLITNSFNLPWLYFKDLSAVISVLDPENTGIPQFYVYSLYDEELKSLRDKAKELTNTDERELCYFEIQKVEDKVRARLSDTIRPYAADLKENLDMVAQVDAVLAKARFALNYNACRPVISICNNFVDLINIEIADILLSKNIDFQPVNISFENETVLVTGANMGGKTVLLQSLAFAQLLFQFGFFVPAVHAEMTVYDDVMCSFGDQQSVSSGLSSFANEILTIDNIVKTAKRGRKVFALVDELARTTNPEEGRMIVGGFIRMCEKLSVSAVVTTHYSGVAAKCRKLRVRGLQIPASVDSLNAKKISEYMDYSLVETADDEAPKEAFNIARLLEVDEDFIEECRAVHN